jgi:hypothetical protein
VGGLVRLAAAEAGAPAAIASSAAALLLL